MYALLLKMLITWILLDYLLIILMLIQEFSSYPNNLVYEDFTKFKTISPRVTDNASDTVLMVLSKNVRFLINKYFLLLI